MELVKRLRAARAYAQLSREEVASALEMSNTTWERIERGERPLKAWERPAIIDAMATICGLPSWWFYQDWTGPAVAGAAVEHDEVVDGVLEELAEAQREAIDQEAPSAASGPASKKASREAAPERPAPVSGGKQPKRSARAPRAHPGRQARSS